MACVEGQQCDPRATKKGRNCGSNAAYSYFVSFIFFCSFLMLNLFVAVIMDNFDYLTRDSSILGAHHLDEFIRVWSEYDPHASGYIHFTEMYDMLRNMAPPLGFGNKCPSRLAFKKLIRMNMPINEAGKVNFTTTLFALIRENLSIKMRPADEMDQADRELRVTLLKLWPLRAKKMIDKLIPPRVELNEGNLTVGKIYAGLLIHENWKTTRFGQKPGAGGLSGSSLIARLMGAVRNKRSSLEASEGSGGQRGSRLSSIATGTGVPGTGANDLGAQYLNPKSDGSFTADRQGSFRYLRRVSARRQRRLVMMDAQRFEDESSGASPKDSAKLKRKTQYQQHQYEVASNMTTARQDNLGRPLPLIKFEDTGVGGVPPGDMPPISALPTVCCQSGTSSSANDKLAEAVTDIIGFVREGSFKRRRRVSARRRAGASSGGAIPATPSSAGTSAYKQFSYPSNSTTNHHGVHCDRGSHSPQPPPPSRAGPDEIAMDEQQRQRYYVSQQSSPLPAVNQQPRAPVAYGQLDPMILNSNQQLQSQKPVYSEPVQPLSTDEIDLLRDQESRPSHLAKIRAMRLSHQITEDSSGGGGGEGTSLSALETVQLQRQLSARRRYRSADAGQPMNRPNYMPHHTRKLLRGSTMDSPNMLLGLNHLQRQHPPSRPLANSLPRRMLPNLSELGVLLPMPCVAAQSVSQATKKLPHLSRLPPRDRQSLNYDMTGSSVTTGSVTNLAQRPRFSSMAEMSHSHTPQMMAIRALGKQYPQPSGSMSIVRSPQPPPNSGTQTLTDRRRAMMQTSASLDGSGYSVFASSRPTRHHPNQVSMLQVAADPATAAARGHITPKRHSLATSGVLSASQARLLSGQSIGSLKQMEASGSQHLLYQAGQQHPRIAAALSRFAQSTGVLTSVSATGGRRSLVAWPASGNTTTVTSVIRRPGVGASEVDERERDEWM